MISIIRAKVEDFKVLADIGKLSFQESHGHSAVAENINSYITIKYNYDKVKEELKDHQNIYHIIYYNKQAVGYSKIILNAPHTNIQLQNVTLLERLYLLKTFYNLKLGLALFNFNVELAKKNNQTGIWLFVWTENERAVRFYKKIGFKIIGSHNFKISETHSNPNHQMLLLF